MLFDITYTGINYSYKYKNQFTLIIIVFFFFFFMLYLLVILFGVIIALEYRLKELTKYFLRHLKLYLYNLKPVWHIGN